MPVVLLLLASAIAAAGLARPPAGDARQVAASVCLGLRRTDSAHRPGSLFVACAHCTFIAHPVRTCLWPWLRRRRSLLPSAVHRTSRRTSDVLSRSGLCQPPPHSRVQTDEACHFPAPFQSSPRFLSRSRIDGGRRHPSCQRHGHWYAISSFPQKADRSSKPGGPAACSCAQPAYPRMHACISVRSIECADRSRRA